MIHYIVTQGLCITGILRALVSVCRSRDKLMTIAERLEQKGRQEGRMEGRMEGALEKALAMRASFRKWG
nr:hypothetical protein [Escherichia coli]